MLQECFASCKNINKEFLFKKNSAQLSLIKIDNKCSLCLYYFISQFFKIPNFRLIVFFILKYNLHSI